MLVCDLHRSTPLVWDPATQDYKPCEKCAADWFGPLVDGFALVSLYATGLAMLAFIAFAILRLWGLP